MQQFIRDIDVWTQFPALRTRIATDLLHHAFVATEAPYTYNFYEDKEQEPSTDLVHEVRQLRANPRSRIPGEKKLQKMAKTLATQPDTKKVVNHLQSIMKETYPEKFP